MENNVDRVFDWDDTIENEGSQWTLLPEGDYNFRIESFERKHYGGGGKIPACNQAAINVSIDAPEGSTTIQHNLFLYSKMEWKLSEFFIAIGQKKHGEKVRMNWNAVPGACGQCKIGIRKFTKKDGTEGQSNEILKFYDPGEADPTVRNGKKPEVAAAPSWKAGEF